MPILDPEGQEENGGLDFFLVQNDFGIKKTMPSLKGNDIDFFQAKIYIKHTYRCDIYIIIYIYYIYKYGRCYRHTCMIDSQFWCGLCRLSLNILPWWQRRLSHAEDAACNLAHNEVPVSTWRWVCGTFFLLLLSLFFLFLLSLVLSFFFFFLLLLLLLLPFRQPSRSSMESISVEHSTKAVQTTPITAAEFDVKNS